MLDCIRMGISMGHKLRMIQLEDIFMTYPCQRHTACVHRGSEIYYEVVCKRWKTSRGLEETTLGGKICLLLWGNSHHFYCFFSILLHVWISVFICPHLPLMEGQWTASSLHSSWSMEAEWVRECVCVRERGGERGWRTPIGCDGRLPRPLWCAAATSFNNF